MLNYPKALIVILLTLSSLTTKAQKPNVKFGSVSLDDLKKSKYEIDSTADAVILYEKCDVDFRYDETHGFYIESTVHVRKKILKASALSAGTIAIQTYRNNHESSQIIVRIKGATYWLENGSVNKLELTKKDYFEEKMKDKYFQTKISFPKIKEGSIIEYSYTMTSPLVVSNKPDTWNFQGSTPALWSEYVITIPSHFYYQVNLGGYLQLAITEQEKVSVDFGHTKLNTNGIKYTFAVKDAPAFKEEAFVSSKKNYISKVDFELSSVSLPDQMTVKKSMTWPDINKYLMDSDYFGVRLRKSNYLKDLKEKFSVFSDKKERLEKVYYYLNRQFTNSDEYNSIYCEDLKKVWENKKGSSSEQNLLFTALLQELDFKANPVILSTRDHGKINELFPLLDRFNYLICRVELDGKFIHLDISDKSLKLGMLPFNCLNGQGFEINSSSGQFVDLNPTEKQRINETVEAKIDFTKNKITGKIVQNHFGYAGYSNRSDFVEKGLEKMKEDFRKEYTDIALNNLSLTNLEEQEKTNLITFNFESNEEVTAEDMLYINPIFSNKVKENPFKQPERLYPVDFGYSTENVYILNFEVPKDYIIESLPKSTNTVLADKSAQFIYSCTYDSINNKINLVSRMVIKNPMYFAEQYHELKELFNRIVQKHDEQIVLKKK
ncbi:DUF3857 domain-containing protein [Lacihabitans sp. CCS-44]|uniref:DUF3857 domain-containing protein n=1 Tax=Lacihabitans sp. CCS-44 TaxID=2487331 RepID=UPI0020CCB680|nr:DUF3857 domain-containing protein [Lacihabitans sp. CCS-44]MCP9755410.1 DUF3857 domain-containing protein [Lacihabitans sp. CCS-44]